jgi:hypothetical protein
VEAGKRRDLTGGGLIRTYGGWSALKAARTSGAGVVGDERILGGSDFVRSVLEQADETLDRQTRLAAQGIDLGSVIHRVGERLGVDPLEIPGPTRRRTVARARALVCAIAVDLMGQTGVAVSVPLGLSRSAVSKLADRGRKDQELGAAVAAALDGD